jgi:hypothetical protein
MSFRRALGTFDATMLVVGVALVPDPFFELPAHFRVSLGGATEALREGLDAMERRLNETA